MHLGADRHVVGELKLIAGARHQSDAEAQAGLPSRRFVTAAVVGDRYPEHA